MNKICYKSTSTNLGDKITDGKQNGENRKKKQIQKLNEREGKTNIA